MTLLPGYDDSRLCRESPELLDAPGFWPAHLGSHLMETIDEAAALFGDDPEVVERTYARLTGHDSWPVFLFGTGRDARLAVVYRNFAEDEGVDYLLIPDGADAITFATDEGGQFGRGITWNELAALADRQPDDRSRATVLLLLAPMLTIVEVPDEQARHRLARALRTVAVTGDADLIAARILHPDQDEDEDEDHDGVVPRRTGPESVVDRLLVP
ncbi:hypothetical protein AB0G04_10490 [Actinoplanes sp. NPDC023801]|uniref:hypothetical protein n=1 Tax=Actinoplanes sp. NPDC023801 TaxID=3154595 RepID=UPI0034022BD2